MERYYFDIRDGETFLRDEEGFEFDRDERARHEAVRALAGIVKDALPGSSGREIAIEVRKGESTLLTARVIFEIALR
jgi:hypothetical protein